MKTPYKILGAIVLLALAGIGYAAYTNKQQGDDVLEKGSGVRGVVMAGPRCPVMREGVDCPDKPLQTTLVVEMPGRERLSKEFSSNADGTFSLALPAGEYVIRSKEGFSPLPSCTEKFFTVPENAYVDVIVSCDTGIR